jgi:acyl-CoA-binding protein
MGADEFDYAKDRVWDLPRTPDNGELLELYKLLFPSCWQQLMVGINKPRVGIVILGGQGDGI